MCFQLSTLSLRSDAPDFHGNRAGKKLQDLSRDPEGKGSFKDPSVGELYLLSAMHPKHGKVAARASVILEVHCD